MMQLRRIGVLVCLALPLFAIAGSGLAEQQDEANTPRIIMEVPDTVVPPGVSGQWLTIYLSNFLDSIAGVQFQLLIDNPDLMLWDLSGEPFDTTGTLTSGFELAAARDTSGTGTIIRYSALANFPFDGVYTPGFGPQQGGVLVRLPFATAAIADTVTDRTCHISIVAPIAFSDPDANQIGIITDTLLDTIYLQCTLIVADTCEGYVPVDPDTASYDSVHIYPYLYGYLDTSQVLLSDGSITLAVPPQVNCDLTNDSSVNVSDISCLVSYLFLGESGGCSPLVYCGCNNGGTLPEEPNVGDLACLVDYLFRGGPPPGSG
jgi:hypothetical protein